MALSDQTTFVSKVIGVMQSGGVKPTDANNGLTGLSGSGQMFYNNGLNAVEIHEGSSVWVDLQMTTTSTSSSTSTSTSTTST